MAPDAQWKASFRFGKGGVHDLSVHLPWREVIARARALASGRQPVEVLYTPLRRGRGRQLVAIPVAREQILQIFSALADAEDDEDAGHRFWHWQHPDAARPCDQCREHRNAEARAGDAAYDAWLHRWSHYPPAMPADVRRARLHEATMELLGSPLLRDAAARVLRDAAARRRACGQEDERGRVASDAQDDARAARRFAQALPLLHSLVEFPHERVTDVRVRRDSDDVGALFGDADGVSLPIHVLAARILGESKT